MIKISENKKMGQNITSDNTKKAQEEAQWAYEKAKEKFYYSMLEVVFLRIKSHLNEHGLQKVMKMDEKRNNNENLGVEFSQKTWAVLAESWVGAENLAITKIAALYELEASDFDFSKVTLPKEEV